MALTSPIEAAPRKGARRMAEIPPRVLKDLNAGRIETLTLVEWLAIDIEKLAATAARDSGFGDIAEELAEHARRLKKLGILQRTEGMGAVLFTVAEKHPKKLTLLNGAANHASDTVRNWAAYALIAFEDQPLERRLKVARNFAADSHMGVREIAWMALRPHLVQDLDRSFDLLATWTKDPDESVRRFASEATRPRGVWCAHIEILKENPEPGLKVLEPLKSDPSPYVRRSVANWLNDASKSRPDWVKKVTARWLKESKTKETAWIVHHATRTMRKKPPVRAASPKRPKR